ncbi:MAG: NUDIX domain-containing protein [Alphaproteobacteria bacterium]|nr:NUDIX domain-containing protein [Alphaproteobacteria bacterium]
MSDAEPYPLYPAHSVGAIIVTPDQRFLLQRRDHVPHIWYPGAWGLFGGGIDPGESERDALRRELREEIGLELGEARLFTRFQFDCAFVGDGMIDRTFFEVPLTLDAVAGLRLSEGREMALIAADQVLGLPDMIGHDGFVLYQYLNRHRISPPRP